MCIHTKHSYLTENVNPYVVALVNSVLTIVLARLEQPRDTASIIVEVFSWIIVFIASVMLILSLICCSTCCSTCCGRFPQKVKDVASYFFTGFSSVVTIITGATSSGIAKVAGLSVGVALLVFTAYVIILLLRFPTSSVAE